VVVLIHGGFWRAEFSKALMSRLARAVTTRGWAAWNIEYRRVGLLGGGGGWPETLVDVGAAIDHVQQLPQLDPSRLVTCGHSAGGQLALWARRPAANRLPD
jgi:acetyl esterase/lipase